MIKEQSRKAIEAALLALVGAEGAIAAARETLSAVSVALDKGPVPATEWLDVDAIIKRYPVSKRSVLGAYRKKKLRGSKPAGSRAILFTLADVEDWIHARGGNASLRVVR